MQTFVALIAVVVVVVGALWILVPAVYGLPPVSTNPERIRRALELANLQPDETLYDLGCGHGRVLIMATREFNAHAVGVEVGPVQCAVAWVNALRNGVRSKVHIEAGDFYKSDLRQADVVYMYLTSSHAGRIQKKLEKELRSGARVVTVSFDLEGWQPVFFDRENLIYLYIK